MIRFRTYHCDVIRASIVPNDFQWPRFINVLVDIDDSRTDQGKPVHMRSKYCALFVDTDTIQTAFCKPLSRPFLNGIPSRIPNFGFQYTPSSFQIQVFYRDNFRRAFPMINISVTWDIDGAVCIVDLFCRAIVWVVGF